MYCTAADMTANPRALKDSRLVTSKGWRERGGSREEEMGEGRKEGGAGERERIV